MKEYKVQITAKRIREIRGNKTQKEFAELLNTDQTTISHYENGDYDIPLHRIFQICVIFQVSADYILGLTDI